LAGGILGDDDEAVACVVHGAAVFEAHGHWRRLRPMLMQADDEAAAGIVAGGHVA